LIDNTYTRQVYAIDNLGHTGELSNIRTFIIDTIAPTIPELLAPDNAHIFYTGNIDFLWSGSTDIGVGMSGYMYQISKNI